MSRSRCRKLLVLVALASTIVALPNRRIHAAGSPAPTVSILRNTSLAQTTWPGDFNGDGIMDVAATAPRGPGAPLSPIVISLGNGNGTFQTPWTVIGRQTFTEFSSVSAGMAVTSHHDGRPATADFDSVDLHIDPGFVSNDVGTTGGSTTSDGVITTMTAKGTDVWGTSDQHAGLAVTSHSSSTATASFDDVVIQQ